MAGFTKGGLLVRSFEEGEEELCLEEEEEELCLEEELRLEDDDEEERALAGGGGDSSSLSSSLLASMASCSLLAWCCRACFRMPMMSPKAVIFRSLGQGAVRGGREAGHRSSYGVQERVTDVCES